MKLCAPDRVGSASARARFLTEATLTATLRHPGILAVHDRGERPDGVLWYTMEIVSGRTLAEHLRTTERLRDRVAAVERACEALAYAHREGVVHRDLKPDNVMLDEFGGVRIIDWGIAARVGDPPEPGLGTPGWVAPEQARGCAPDPSADVYGLGSLLHLAITGDGVRRGPSAELWRLVQEQPPDVFAEVPPGVPPALAAACRAAMSPDPAGRPTAGALAAALSAWLEADARAAAADRVFAEVAREAPPARGAQAADRRAPRHRPHPPRRAAHPRVPRGQGTCVGPRGPRGGAGAGAHGVRGWLAAVGGRGVRAGPRPRGRAPAPRRSPRRRAPAGRGGGEPPRRAALGAPPAAARPRSPRGPAGRRRSGDAGDGPPGRRGGAAAGGGAWPAARGGAGGPPGPDAVARGPTAAGELGAGAPRSGSRDGAVPGAPRPRGRVGRRPTRGSGADADPPPRGGRVGPGRLPRPPPGGSCRAAIRSRSTACRGARGGSTGS
jgi:hypothetical protein